MPVDPSVTAILRRAPHEVRIALVGASRAGHKYGNIILRDLLAKGYEVWPVNPRFDEIEGLRSYPSLAELPGVPDIVDFVVPPAAARAVVAELEPGPGPVLWFQPGAFDAAVIDAAEATERTIVAGPCIMVEAPAR